MSDEAVAVRVIFDSGEEFEWELAADQWEELSFAFRWQRAQTWHGVQADGGAIAIRIDRVLYIAAERPEP